MHAHFACAAGGESRGCEPGMRTGGEQQRATVCSLGTSHASLLRHTKWGVCEHDRTRTLVWVPHACISRIHMPCVRTLDALFRERETWNRCIACAAGAAHASRWRRILPFDSLGTDLPGPTAWQRFIGPRTSDSGNTYARGQSTRAASQSEISTPQVHDSPGGKPFAAGDSVSAAAGSGAAKARAGQQHISP